MYTDIVLILDLMTPKDQILNDLDSVKIRITTEMIDMTDMDAILELILLTNLVLQRKK